MKPGSATDIASVCLAYGADPAKHLSHCIHESIDVSRVLVSAMAAASPSSFEENVSESLRLKCALLGLGVNDTGVLESKEQVQTDEIIDEAIARMRQLGDETHSHPENFAHLLRVAARHGDTVLCEKLIQKGVKPTTGRPVLRLYELTSDKQCHHPFFEAAQRGHLETCRLILAMFPECIYTANTSGMTPLMAAIQTGHIDVCFWMIMETDANIETADTLDDVLAVCEEQLQRQPE